MKRNLHIENSYCISKSNTMKTLIKQICIATYMDSDPEKVLNRSYKSMIIEWYLHNIGYYITKPLCFISFVKKLNERFRCVDINER